MIYSIFLQAEAAPQGNGMLSQLLLFGGIALVFYFFMIRPQQKKQKDQKKFISEISKGDAVVTIGGIHGKVFASDEETVTLEVDKSTKIKFERSAISLEASKREAGKA
ncbi:preprotein translocase subunit YajC [Roseivirga misakiensis]|uniref:Sec translocon accessory complex subunit YajC n=1 Tax=Roseivirga misakiensis TaxID=1563681 RepID=A0A1E5T4K0_9BACT|nr:preprotein translocase subunit YajC [Roseivirga misakiensis]OEK06323.1 preprotein translocase subunit YajC [Roseivirga misakiensis]